MFHSDIDPLDVPVASICPSSLMARAVTSDSKAAEALNAALHRPLRMCQKNTRPEPPEATNDAEAACSLLERFLMKAILLMGGEEPFNTAAKIS